MQNIVLVFIAIFILLIILIYFMKKSKIKIKDDYFDIFLKNIKLYMKVNHPKIELNFSFLNSFTNQSKKSKQTLVIQEVLSQFYDYSYTKETQKSIPKSKLWQNFVENPKNDRLPTDWAMRKEFAFNRDKNLCNRCNHLIKDVKDAQTSFVKDIDNGGSYSFENIIIFCPNCKKVVDSNTSKDNVISSLELYDELLKFIVD